MAAARLEVAKCKRKREEGEAEMERREAAALASEEVQEEVARGELF